MAECIDLKKFQEKFRVFTAESYSAETGSKTNSNSDPWHLELRGSRGHVSPWGGEFLVISLNDGHSKLSKRLSDEFWVVTSRGIYLH